MITEEKGMNMEERCTLGEKDFCYVPLTIEQHLKNYSECQGHIERHEILWHEWNHNKRWLIQMQQWILPSFPSYSRHDISHSEAVIHNIELVLGEENIRSLSATDCFVLLHVVYIHDIGMCITHEDKKNILKDEAFQRLLQQLEEDEDSELGHYASLLLSKCYLKKEEPQGDEISCILEQKLEVYYAIIYLIAEFRRREHGSVSKKRLLDWINEPDKLGMGFSTIELPSRLFYVIANCAATHTSWNFEDVLNLEQEDTGFALDYIHPRFVAVMLQLGDALDMDNDRFHPLTTEFTGILPAASQLHYRKHKAIRGLIITNQIISISADCTTQEELRLIRMECDGIREILKNATYSWSVIKPSGSSMGLPTLKNVRLLLNGKEIPLELADAQFQISQEKAFNLITGASIYKDKEFVYLRELLQNAMDATKLQYFRDFRMNLKKREILDEDVALKNPIETSRILSTSEYPIQIELRMAKKKDNIIEDIALEDLNNPAESLKDYRCGVLVKIRDYATGISEQEIGLVADVGSSYSLKKDEIEQMPSWLQPTGTFGIGLQSAFLATNVLTAVTHNRDGKTYEITFHPRMAGAQGYINVMPKSSDANIQAYGTCFELFVQNDKKLLHHESPDTWDGADPFGENYKQSRAIRHARELLKQMALSIENYVGETIFPISMSFFDCDEEKLESHYPKSFLKKLGRVPCTVVSGKKKLIYKNGKEVSGPQIVDKGTLICGTESMWKLLEEKKGDFYLFDYEKAKLYVWNNEYGACASVGIERIAEMRKYYNSTKKAAEEKGVWIFYKGINVTRRCFKKDFDLIEFIDLKSTINQDFLRLNRNGFSQSGYEYMEKVYAAVLDTAREALHKIGMGGIQTQDSDLQKLLKHAEELLNKNNDTNNAQKEEWALSVAVLIYVAIIKEPDENCFFSEESSENNWQELLEKLKDLIKSSFEKEASAFFNITVWKKYAKSEEDDKEVSAEPKCTKVTVFDIIDANKKYAILSKRSNSSMRDWKQYLLDVTDYYEMVKNEVTELQRCIDYEKRREHIAKLDQKIAEIFKESFEWSLRNYDEFSDKEQIILRWFIDKVPSMALCTTLDGNTRLNFLDAEVCSSIYLSATMKNLVINRVIEQSRVDSEENGYQRFSTCVWSGYQNLSLQKSKYSVKFVKRGKLSKIGFDEMIFPLTGEEFCCLNDKCCNDVKILSDIILTLLDELSQIMLKLMDDKMDETQKMLIKRRFWRRVLEDIKKNGMQLICTDKTDASNSDDYGVLKKRFSQEAFSEQEENREEKEREKEEAERLWEKKITSPVCQCKKKLHSQMYTLSKDSLKLFPKDSSAYINLTDEVLKNGKCRMNNAEITRYYQCLFMEMRDAILYSKLLTEQKLFPKTEEEMAICTEEIVLQLFQTSDKKENVKSGTP